MNLCFCEFAFVLVELRKAHMAGMNQCVWLRRFCGRFELILEDTLRFTKSVLLLVHLCEAVAREVQTGGIMGRLRFGHRRSAVFRSEEHTSELQSRFDLVCR